MAKKRKKAASRKQQRHNRSGKAQTSQSSVNTPGESSAKPSANSGGSSKKPHSTRSVSKSHKPNKHNPSPINKEGTLSWGKVQLPRVAEPSQLELTLPQATLRDQELPALAWAFGILAFFGIILSTGWSPLLLSVLTLVTLLDQRIRENKWAVIQVVISAVLCAACWPLISQTKAIATMSMTQLAAVTLVVFAGALWMTGVVTRRSSLLQNSMFSRTGLYSLGIACQSLAVVVMFAGTMQLYILAT